MINASFTFSANSLIFDLEDSVSLEEKDSARILLQEALPLLSELTDTHIAIRINSEDELWQEDLELLRTNLVQTVVIPKAKTNRLKEIAAKLDQMNIDTRIAAIIEDTQSLEELSHIATATSRITSLLLGAEDFSFDLGVERTMEGEEIRYARMRIANAAAAHGLEALDTPYVDTKDFEGLAQEARYVKGLGFTGKLAISPLQIEIIQSIFNPTEHELRWAALVVEAANLPENQGKGAFSLHGKMVDLPVIRRAEKILARSAGKGEQL